MENDELLNLIERENKAFKDHWLFRELQCTPDELFEATKKFGQQMGLTMPSNVEAPRIARQLPKSFNKPLLPSGNRFIVRA